MTEEEWLECTDYVAMLIYLRGDKSDVPTELKTVGFYFSAGHLGMGNAERASRRKLRPLAAAMCQTWWPLPIEGFIQRFLKFYQKIANDAELWKQVVELDMDPEQDIRGQESEINLMPDTPLGVQQMASYLAWQIADHIAKDTAGPMLKNGTPDELEDWGWGLGPPDPLWQSTRKRVENDYPLLLREIIGNPFRAVSLPVTWLTPKVVAMGQQIYDDRAFDRLPILGDALEEGGCTNAEVLNHCRGPGPHVRGCWAVDLVLGKG